ncbi:hypothetical protein L7F22_049238 [Adiantum nelumboides]|nr:hypothetical protein [Adiantum nelumboides]
MKSTDPSRDERPIPSKLFFQSGHWNLKETITLLDARVKLLQEMKEGDASVLVNKVTKEEKDDETLVEEASSSGKKCKRGDKATILKKDDETLVEEASSSGKKCKRGDKATILKKELEGTAKQHIAFMDRIDTRRAKHDDDIVELMKAEFEEAVALNRQRLALEEVINSASKQIVEAFRRFAMQSFSGMESN